MTAEETPRPSKVTFDVKELFAEIRDELRSLNFSILAKADKSELDKLEGRFEMLERERLNRSAKVDSQIQSLVEKLDDLPSRVRIIENGKAPAETVATLAQEMTKLRIFVAKAAGGVAVAVVAAELALRYVL